LDEAHLLLRRGVVGNHYLRFRSGGSAFGCTMGPVRWDEPVATTCSRDTPDGATGSLATTARVGSWANAEAVSTKPAMIATLFS